MRSAWRLSLLFSGVALVSLLVVALTTSTTRAFTLGVISVAPSPEIRGGHEACQRPITVPPDGEFDKVDIEVGTYFRSGPALDVIVRSLDDAFPPRRGRLPAGYPDVGQQQRHIVTVGD